MLISIDILFNVSIYTFVDIITTYLWSKLVVLAPHSGHNGTSNHVLTEAAKLESGGGAGGNQRVLIIGASGGIGSTFIPVLRHLYPELYIVGVCSSRNTVFVKKLGATDVID